jgi:hypothetical protein
MDQAERNATQTPQPVKARNDNNEARNTIASYTAPTSATGTSQPGMNCRPAARASENMDA